MDGTGELAEMLRSWRSRLAPAQVGLPANAARRTQGLRREELAVLAGVSIDYIVRLEQGRASTPSAQVCVALARALQLSDTEQAYRHRQLVEPVRRYGHGWGRPGRVPRSVSGHCGRGRASDLVPDDESLGHCAAVLGGGEPVTAGPEVRGDTTEGGQEPLGMTR